MNILFHIYPLLILANNVLPLNIPIFSDLQDIIGLAHDLSDLSSGRVPFIGGLFGTVVDPTQAKLAGLSMQITKLTETINIKMDKLMAVVLDNVPKTIQFNSVMSKLISYVTRIDDLFEDYQYYVSEKGLFHPHTVDDFSAVTTSHKYGDVQDILRQIYHLFIPGELGQENQSILELMTFVLNSTEIADRCNKLKTPQQQLYDLYEIVVLTEVKSFVMSTYGYGLLSIYKNASFAPEVKKAVAQVVKRCEKYLSFTTKALKTLPREIFLCDPPKHFYGITHVKLTSIRKILVHESMVFRDETCPETCGDLYGREYYRNYENKWADDSNGRKWVPNNPCRGRLLECEDIGEVTFCELSKYSDHRFDWIKSDYGFMGQNENCDFGNVYELANFQRSWYKCTSCLCTCTDEDRDSNAIRTLSLRPQMADIANNMVVTGVRFELKDKMVSIQIEEGKLLSAGRIQSNSTRLVELEKFVYIDNVSGGGWALKGDNESVPLEQGKDYQFIMIGQRDVNLDNIYSREPGYVVTGLKLSRDSENSKAVELEIHLTPFNFSSGKLVPTDDKPSKWINSGDMIYPGYERKDLDLVNRQKPNAKGFINLPYSEDYMQTWFLTTEKWQDVGQNTVPYFDKQLVAADPRVPLDGAAIYLRAAEKSGGFLAFKLYTFDISQYLQPTMTPESIELYKDAIGDNDKKTSGN